MLALVGTLSTRCAMPRRLCHVQSTNEAVERLMLPTPLTLDVKVTEERLEDEGCDDGTTQASRRWMKAVLELNCFRMLTGSLP